jgi:uncharacterized protein
VIPRLILLLIERNGIERIRFPQSLTCAMLLNSVLDMKRYIGPLIVIFCLLPICAGAMRVPGLYTADVPVADQSDKTRQGAVRTALRMVLVKLTGDRFAGGRADLEPLIRQAENYVQEYRYRQTRPENEDPGTLQEMQLLLSVRFNEESLNQSLRNLSVPVWGSERPSTLIWMVVEQNRERALISMDSASPYISVIDNRANLRGIALIFPLLDLEDTARLRPGDVWGNFKQPVMDASVRYHPDSVLTGILTALAPGIWEARWTAYINDQTHSWVTEGDLPDVVLDEGVDGMADILAQMFARSSVFTEKTTVRLSIADIHNVEQYARVLKYFKSLSSVSDVQVEQVASGVVTFLLSVHGGGLAVSQAIALTRIMEPISGSRGMAYRLLP